MILHNAITSHTVTILYNHALQWKIIESSERNDIIQHVIHMLILRQTHSYLE